MFKKIPWFAAWDPLALEIYVECQIYEDEDAGEVKLKMTGVWVCILPGCEGERTASLNTLHRRPLPSWSYA